jgi:OmpA-OmpF porin, OOP family
VSPLPLPRLRRLWLPLIAIALIVDTVACGHRAPRSAAPRAPDETFDATTTEQGQVVYLVERFFFEPGQVELSADAESAIARVAARLNERRVRRRPVSVEGHSDATGTAETNARISAERAEGVAALLVQHGVHASRIHSRGFGDTRPLVAERGRASAEVRARNRRVDIILSN